MPIEAAVGTASGSSSAAASGSTRPQGAATATRAAFSQEEFRTVIWKSTPVRDQYGKVARDTKKDPIVSYFDDLTSAQAMVDERGAILGAHARRFRVVVDTILTEADLNFDEALPAATFIDDELVANMTVVVAAIESVDFNTGQTTLLVWGKLGDTPEADEHIYLGAGAAQGGSTAVAIGVSIREAVGTAAGIGATTGTLEGTIAAVGVAAGTGDTAAAAANIGNLLTEGDMQSGTDSILLVGDMQSGTDVEQIED